MHVFRSVCCTFVLCFIYKCLMDTLQQLVKSIILGIQEKKGSNIVVADLQKIEGSICKFFVVCQGNSPQQVKRRQFPSARSLLLTARRRSWSAAMTRWSYMIP